MSALDEALKAVGLGYAIVPNTPTKEKTPYFPGWMNGAALTKVTDVEAFWSKHPEANVGIRTGDHGLFILDIDGDLGRASLAALEAVHGKLPETYVVSSGRTDGGTHYYFTGAIGFGCNSDVRAGIDYRCDGGFIVGAGSIHVTGTEYRVVSGSLDKLAVLPEWIADMVTSYKRGSQPGSQHYELLSKAGKLWNMGMDVDTLADALWAIAKRFPPLDPAFPWRFEDARKMAQSFEDGDYQRTSVDIVQASKPVVYGVDDFLAMPIPTELWRVEGLLQAVGTGYFLGARKHGKSLALMQMAWCIASGTPFLGMKVQQAPVLLIEEEGGTGFYQRHMQRQHDELGLGKGLPLYVSHRQKFRIDQPKSIQFLKDEIERTGAKVVLMGTMSKLARMKDSYKPEEWNNIGMTVNDIATDYGCMVDIALHTRKDTLPKSVDDMTDNALGSTQIGGTVDSIIGLWRPTGQDEGVVFYLPRDDEAGQIGVRFNYPLFERDDSLLATKKVKTASSVVDWLRNQKSFATVETVAEKASVSVSTAQRTLDELKANGDVVVRIGKGRGRAFEYLFKPVSAINDVDITTLINEF